MLRSAVERQFEIAGEALNRLSRETPEIAAQLPDIRGAVAMHSALTLGYREVDNATAWQTIHEGLPAPRMHVEALLAKLGDHP